MAHFSGVCALFCPPITDGQASIIGKRLLEGKGKVLRSSRSSTSKAPAIDFVALTHLVLADSDCRGVTLSALRRKLHCQTLPATLPHLVSTAWVIRSAAGKVKLDEGPFRVPVLPEPEPEAVLEPFIAEAGEGDGEEKQESKEDGGGGKRPRLQDCEQSAPSSSSSSASSASAAFPPYRPNYAQIAAEAPKDASGRPVSFKNVLSPYAARPHDFPASVFSFHRGGEAGEVGSGSGSGAADLVVIYDRFPKARVHLLVLPAQHYIESEGIADLAPAQLRRLEAMHALARRLADSLQAQLQGQGQGRGRGAKMEVRLGYHAIPSIPHLHLHVISSDLDSPQLSKKAHWNSFTTDFLVPPERVEKALRERGGCGEIVRQFRGSGAGGHGWTQQQEMRCPRCGLEGRSLPAMKGHYAECGEEG